MRIAIVQSFYRSRLPSGENRVVEDQVDALLDAGHNVLTIRQDTDALQGRLYPLRTAANVALGKGFDPSSQLEHFRPDVIHVHNLFPNISTRWMTHRRTPIVASLHNYRLTCSNGLFFRDGNLCTECVDHGPIRAVIHGCYHNSRVATLPVAISRRRTRDDFRNISVAVTTSELSDQIVRQYVGGGLPTVMIPNFGSDARRDIGDTPVLPRWIAAGRLTPEKGILELVRDWPPDESLLIVGDGPQRAEVEIDVKQRKEIEFLPSVNRHDFRALLAASQGLVFPSRWFEADPQVVVEAMSLGIPVVACHVNATAGIILRSGAGSVYSSRAELAQALRQVKSNHVSMSKAAREEFSRRWTKELWLERITNVYRRVLGE